MKKQFLLMVLLGIGVHGIAQTPPTNTNPLNAGQTSQDYWSRAGNNSNGNNIFGLKINSPIYTIAGAGDREILRSGIHYLNTCIINN